LIASKHRRSFVFKVLVKELSIRCIMIGGRYPFPWHYAWESYAYTCSTIKPVGSGPACEPFAEVGGEVVAVLRQEIVGRALEAVRGLLDVSFVRRSHGTITYFEYDSFELFLGSKREAMEYSLFKGASRWFLAGSMEFRDIRRMHAVRGLPRPVYASQPALIMTSICKFFVVDDHPGVEERATYSP
jgi:hypothetical protein